MDTLTAILWGRNQGLGRTIDSANAEIEKGNETIRQLERELIQSRANAKGAAAQAKALLDENPNTKLRQLTGERYKSKSGFKSKLSVIYEKAFDKYMRENGINNPETYRTD